MLIETGVVVRAEAGAIWVKTLRKTTCGNCQARHGCGQSLLQRMATADADIRARFDPGAIVENLNPGDEVEIAIEEGALLAASLLAYGLPLMFLILGVVLAESWAFGELLQFLLGVFGLAAGLWISRLILFSRFKPAYFEPRVVRNLSSLSSVVASS